VESDPRARVLLVDDETLVRATLAASLRGAGHQVLEAEDAGAALRQLATAGDRPDLLVTDLTMPGRTGADLIRDARLLYPGLPAMLMTGYLGVAAVETIGDVGRGPFSLLHKPVDPDRFAEVVMTLLASAAPPPA
jgi:CheY-like chemotaxis protein